MSTWRSKYIEKRTIAFESTEDQKVVMSFSTRLTKNSYLETGSTPAEESDLKVLTPTVEFLGFPGVFTSLYSDSSLSPPLDRFHWVVQTP